MADQERLELLAPEAKGWQQIMGPGASADPMTVRNSKMARLKASKVLCIGSGGLGSPALMYLAAAGA